ncbi:MAG: hypothetical protein JRF59_05855 [Deltaproteobacteria bacterium]|nr:hypothetical protein [Deltaproteobacteria bacterium]MBW1923432.1 hypothetical protein [Deltaproteobacteria bacterium]MBW1948844.1 hypothetical protein [Deltaproteobacteria bacterium]MBW2008944.1 hypothetical protein [Deltaproteobacteria bacterium]MBW2103100.1 hypothetical protein [Deltaproteobacteria bacterium]
MPDSFFSRIPKPWLIPLGKALGLSAYALDLRHRRIVKRNLRFANPDWPAERVLRVSRQVFQHAACTFLEIAQMTGMRREDVLSRVRVEGEEHLTDAIRDGKGAIIISAHMGNWEMAVVFASCFLSEPLVAVARTIRSRAANRRILALRTRFGNIILDKQNALPKMVRMLRQGRSLGILIDQGTVRSEGVEVEFFGKTTTATPVAALLGRRYGRPVVPAFCVREPDGAMKVIIRPPVELQKTEDLQADLQVNTQRMTFAIEEMIRAYPEQWFWFHKRWKRHYPGLYPEDLARRRRRREKRKAKAARASG